ncbi:DNA polymerase III, beta subunit [Bernardetia litoralis DSM 6794]|uniref:Beta sliding clamp n=1 Tax=Bernardetia litoralis (strain ATCC 23117 / DSM 6794 / NBRC 15988 / NCIMB 1366 / Fx l1 / Sio-4) TaxID=880071 RepID=I4AMT5_BERLS|nr:DNA polymerase III subunit beta [Bernardetia litoralis]AFM05270.1 DNA polymerase III, beta subunit [Bernardetia litoralis DSM 6794]
MKFIVSSAALLKQLNSLKGLVPSNPVIPILENFLFEISDGLLRVTASDLQNAMTLETAVETDEKANVAVPARMLLDTLRNLPEQPITFTIDTESHGIEILSDNGRYTLAGEDAGDFPRPAEPKNTTNLMFSSDVISSAIAYALFAVSSDEMKPAMNGIFVNLADGKTNFVATDSHRLVRYSYEGTEGNSNSSIIIPGKAFEQLKNALPSSPQEIQLEFNDTNVFFSFANIKMVSRLIDERFPDYENVIPTNNDKNLNIDRSQLLSSLKRISIYANKTSQQIRFKLENNNLLISAEDVDFSNEAKENLPCDYDGETLEIGFNGKFLMEMLSNLNCDTVHFEFSEPNRAALMYPSEATGDENILMLVMPVMLNNYY